MVLGLMLGLLGPLGASFWPKLALVGPGWPKITQKSGFFEFKYRKLAQVGSQKWRKIDAASDMILRCIFDIDFQRFLIDFGLENSTFLGSIF